MMNKIKSTMQLKKQNHSGHRREKKRKLQQRSKVRLLKTPRTLGTFFRRCLKFSKGISEKSQTY